MFGCEIWRLAAIGSRELSLDTQWCEEGREGVREGGEVLGRSTQGLGKLSGYQSCVKRSRDTARRLLPPCQVL